MSKNFMTPNELLDSEAVAYLRELHREFESPRQKLLTRRTSSENSVAAILASPSASMTSDWTVAPIPQALECRHVEITGPAEAKMIINALKSGADVFMADLEDALSPTWANILSGHAALQRALRRTLSFTGENGKTYSIAEAETKLATLIVRPRGWHLPESRFEVDGEAMSGALFDFGLYLFHGGRFGIETGRGPFFYLPKMESPLEARLWADVFRFSERRLGLKEKSIRVTALIETLPGALQMEDILFELRDFIVGLNAGRWDYLFSMIKSTAGTEFEITFPDRAKLTMDVPFMRRYAEKIVAVCERRQAMAIGGMSALIPSRKDVEKNERALANVKADKAREAGQRFRGTWVAHPDLVEIARAAFSKTAIGAPAIVREISATEARSKDLLPIASEEPFVSQRPTESGARLNIDVSLRYLAHWLNGLGAVAIHGLMEDAATAEISRAQLWQWRKNAVTLDSGTTVTRSWLEAAVRLAAQEILKNEDPLSFAASDLKTAEELLLELISDESPTFPPFLTLPAMDRLNRMQGLRPSRTTEGDQHVRT